MSRLISVAAVLQIGEARIMASELAEAVHAKQATSGHPEHGMRPCPDEMAGVIEALSLRWDRSHASGRQRSFRMPSTNACSSPLRCVRLPVA